MAVWHEETQYVCEEHCNKKFSKKSYLTAHLNRVKQ
jgi:hypothetical protein